jgi:acetyl esterase/lipase
MRSLFRWGLVLGLVSLTAAVGVAQDNADVKRERDVIYGRKFGLALTMDVFTPKKPNGLGVIFVVSGGWFSRPDMINARFWSEPLSRGYTVFAVVHGSQPKFTTDEIVEDMHRAVRFIRHNAKRFGIDPDRIGIMGASAGGHLSLMMATAGKPGDKKATDAVDRESSAVQATGVFFPPTDFLNWGKEGNELIDRQLQPPFTAAVDYHEFDKKRALFVPVTDKGRLREIARAISPIYHVKEGSAPALIIHGDKDKLVPLQQAERIMAKYKECKVPAKLVVREGAAHGWPTIVDDVKLIADWFDEHLRKKAE